MWAFEHVTARAARRRGGVVVRGGARGAGVPHHLPGSLPSPCASSLSQAVFVGDGGSDELRGAGDLPGCFRSRPPGLPDGGRLTSTGRPDVPRGRSALMNSPSQPISSTASGTHRARTLSSPSRADDLGSVIESEPASTPACTNSAFVLSRAAVGCPGLTIPSRECGCGRRPSPGPTGQCP